MDSDLSDIQKIQTILSTGADADSGKDDDDSSATEPSSRCGSADGYSMASSYQAHLTPGDHSFSVFGELTSQSQDDEHFIFEDMDPSLENALVLNKAYQTMLIEVMQQLEVVLSVNKGRQRTVQSEIDLLTSQSNEAKKQDKPRRRKVSFPFFGMPYFKDYDYSHPPNNDDTNLAEAIGFKNVALVTPYKPFSKYEIRWLKASVRDQALAIEASHLMKRREELEKQLVGSHTMYISEHERGSIEHQIELVQRQIFDINSCPDEKLFDVPPDSFDWQKISFESFHRSRTPDQLRLYWANFMRPSVNFHSWTVAENRQLKESVKKYDDGVDWEEVALALKTNRTPFECFRRYQERFNTRHRKFGWTKEENVKLINLVSSYTDSSMSDIDWQEMMLHFPGRSRSQIYAHIKYHTHLHDTSPFSPVEDIAIMEGVKIGYGFADIALLLGKRTTAQVRLRYRAIKGKMKGKDRPWTEKEDNALLSLKDTFQLRRRMIQREFPGRNFPQLFSRFHYVRMKSTTPQNYVEELKAKAEANKSKTRRLLHRQKFSRNMIDMISKFAHVDREEHRKSMKTGLPQYKKELAKSFIKSVEFNRRGRYSRKHGQRKTINNKGKELKEILRPLLNINTKRPRKLSFPGDGREYGIILTCLYRLLMCNFISAPSPETTEKELEQMGLAPQDTLPFKNLLQLIEGFVSPSDAPEPISCLPPTLSTLTGFRGLLLHRKYLQTSASRDYVPPERVERPPSVIITEFVSEESVTGSHGNIEDSNGAESETTSSAVVNDPLAMDDHQQLSLREGSIISTEPEGQRRDEVEVPIQEECVQGSDDLRGGFTDSRMADAEVTSNIVLAEQLKLSEVLVCSAGPAQELRADLQEFIQEGMEASLEQSEEEEEEEDIEDQDYNATEDDDAVEADDVEGRRKEGADGSDEEVADGPYFGDRRADSMLLYRLISLFYWPGIMSTMPVPEDLQKKSSEPEAATEPSQTVPETPKPKFDRRIMKKEAKERRRKHILAVVQKRFGKKTPDPDDASSAAEGAESAPTAQPAPPATPSSSTVDQVSDVETPPPKKARSARKRKEDVPVSDRVIRTRGRTAADAGT